MVLKIDRLKRVNKMGCETFGLELTDPKSTFNSYIDTVYELRNTNKRVITFLLMLL